LDVAPAPEKLVLSFAPFVLLETSEFRRLFRERPVRFSLLEPNDLEEIFHRAERLGDRSFGNLSWHSFRFALPDKFFGDLLAGSFFMRGGENREIYRRMKSERGHTFFGIKNGSSEPFKEVVIDDFVASKMLQFYLAEIIGLAEQNQIEVYWYTMPFNASSGSASRSIATEGCADQFRLSPGSRQLDAHDLAHALLFHRDAVENVRHRDRALVVGDDQELGVGGEIRDQGVEAADVGVVERGVDLVEQEERRGPHLEDRH
jgi:hypothetical protein